MLDLSKINIGPQKKIIKRKTQEEKRKKTPIKKNTLMFVVSENF